MNIGDDRRMKEIPETEVTRALLPTVEKLFGERDPKPFLLLAEEIELTLTPSLEEQRLIAILSRIRETVTTYNSGEKEQAASILQTEEDKELFLELIDGIYMAMTESSEMGEKIGRIEEKLWDSQERKRIKTEGFLPPETEKKLREKKAQLEKELGENLDFRFFLFQKLGIMKAPSVLEASWRDWLEVRLLYEVDKKDERRKKIIPLLEKIRDEKSYPASERQGAWFALYMYEHPEEFQREECISD